MAANEALADRCRVVLVRPAIAGNVGATARVMRNFGLRHLRLVAPVADVNDRRARQLSTHGEAILDAAQLSDVLPHAIADCVLVFGTSARIGGRFREDNVRTPRAAMAMAAAALVSGPIAIVFGPEQSGLSNEEVTLCHYLVNIPTSPDYPALNLAQSVGIVLYELYQAANDPPVRPASAIAPHELQERVFAELQQALNAIGFLRGENATALVHAIRHLLGRAQPSPMEARLLLGMARQMLWHAGANGQG